MSNGLKRSINLPLITLYGIGSILGAGIYVLISKIAGISGIYMPFSFLIAGIIAGFCAFSYAELSSRYPRSAGEAVYIQEAFHTTSLSALAGWAIVFVGIVSVATLANGLIGYVNLFIHLPGWAIKSIIVTILFLISILGVKQSVSVAGLITFIEITGLLIIIYFGFENLYKLPEVWKQLIPPPDTKIFFSLFFGAFLCFYAFIGFEDMVNMAEEVQNPEYNMPVSIIITLVVTTLLYVLVALISILSLPLEAFVLSSAPFADIIKQTGNFPVPVIGVISLIAIVNGMLIQILMASRVLYGMSLNGMAPSLFANIHTATKIPLRATSFVYVLIIAASLTLPIVSLAKITSAVTLSVFAVVNLSLAVIKIHERRSVKDKKENYVSFPLFIPVLGFVLCIVFLVLQVSSIDF